MILKLLDGLSSKIQVARDALAAVCQAGNARCLQTPHTCAQQPVWDSRDQIQKDVRNLQSYPGMRSAETKQLLRPALCSAFWQPLPTSTGISQCLEVEGYVLSPSRQSQTGGIRPGTNPCRDVCSALQPPARTASTSSVLHGLFACFPLFPLQIEFPTLRTFSTAEPCRAGFAAILPSSSLLKGSWSFLCSPVSFWC